MGTAGGHQSIEVSDRGRTAANAIESFRARANGNTVVGSHG